MWTGSSQVVKRKSPSGIPKNASANQREVREGGTSVVFQMACMVPLNENVHLCGVDTKTVTHSGRRAQLLLSATRCGHPSSYIGSSVDLALDLSLTTQALSTVSLSAPRRPHHRCQHPRCQHPRCQHPRRQHLHRQHHRPKDILGQECASKITFKQTNIIFAQNSCYLKTLRRSI